MNIRYGVCQNCGKPVQHHFRGNREFGRSALVCSSSCYLQYYKKVQYQQREQQIVQYILDYYNRFGKAPNTMQVVRALHISKCCLYTHGYSASGIAKLLGTQYRPYKSWSTCSAKQLKEKVYQLLSKAQMYMSNQQVAVKLNVRAAWLRQKLDMSEARRQTGNDVKPRRDFDAIAWQAVQYIKDRNRYVTLNQLLDEFHMDYQATYAKLPYNIQRLNQLAGFQPTNRSAIQQYVYDKLKSVFGQQHVQCQKSFQDLKSSKNHKLRFDFYIPSINVLIQVDGRQHYQVDNFMCTQQLLANDRLKQQYAQKKHIKLIRIPLTTYTDFYTRVDNIMQQLEVVKPIELLEHCQVVDGACTVNQQPSLERRIQAGSETIEQRTEQLQFQF